MPLSALGSDMTCPYLEYRRSDGELHFDHERPFCGVLEEFVSPVKADICNERFDFECESCEIYRAHATGEVPGPTTDD